MKRAIAAVVAALCAVLLAGCGAGARLPTRRARPTRPASTSALLPFYGQAIVWHDCGGGFRCATAQAPEDWAIARRQADPARADHAARLRQPDRHALHEPRRPRRLRRRLPPQRRGPRSTTRTCSTTTTSSPGTPAASAPPPRSTATARSSSTSSCSSDPDLPQGSAALRTDVADAGDRVRQGLPRARPASLLAHVGTADTVQDLDMLRAARGGARSSTTSGSPTAPYIGALYADRFGSHVGRMVLDGAVDPSISTFQEALANTPRLRRRAAGVPRELPEVLRPARSRAATVDGAVDRIAALLVDLRASPMRASDGREVNSACCAPRSTRRSTTSSRGRSLTARDRRLLRGRPDAVQQLADDYVDRGAKGYTSNLFEAIYAVNCLDKPVDDRPGDARGGRGAARRRRPAARRGRHRRPRRSGVRQLAGPGRGVGAPRDREGRAADRGARARPATRRRRTRGRRASRASCPAASCSRCAARGTPRTGTASPASTTGSTGFFVSGTVPQRGDLRMTPKHCSACKN